MKPRRQANGPPRVLLAYYSRPGQDFEGVKRCARHHAHALTQQADLMSRATCAARRDKSQDALQHWTPPSQE